MFEDALLQLSSNSTLLSILATLVGGGAASTELAFAIPSVVDRLQPPPTQELRSPTTFPSYG